ncbi:OmpA family protein [Maribellus maritimus]|uniref:OmpA family protein n=1 Tax=Maribellus maritimus TaxID=2870838 RepID=UPI001EEA0FD0|nr:OmpA family protein [Maribellus maritimus]MCG6187760.1 OmpA family protein [Maribellus maritimus]
MKQNMLLKKFLFLIFIFFFITPFFSEGQSNQRIQKQFDNALLYYKNQDFSSAIGELNKIIEKDSGFQDAYLLLSDVYKEMKNAELEIKNLILAQNIAEKPLINFYLAEAYFSLANYKNALLHYKIYFESGNISEERKSEIARQIENCKFAINAKKNPVDFNPQRLSDNINSNNDEYWPVISLDQKKLVFTRLIRIPGRIPQEDFYFSELNSAGWNKAQPISEINTHQNEGAEILSADEKLLFFTACNRYDGKGSCDIYYSRFTNQKWTQAKNAGVQVNTVNWESQPAFSSDNRFLYFSSNRNGGMGNKDIWKIEFKGFDPIGNIIWGEPENLGKNINTEGNEISPFIHPNNRNFFFVSDFHTGMGGYDIFTSKLSADSVFSKPVNLGYPVNTQNDEQGLNISADGRNAYFASARNENSGLDIYRFELDESIRPTPVTYAKTSVIDAKTKQAIRASINLVDLSESNNVRVEKTDDSGELLVCIPLGTNYAFNVSKEGYLFYSQAFRLEDVKTLREPYIFTIELHPVELGAEMNLYNIYFETDSFSILSKSEPELNKLIGFLENNPSLLIEIQGHTDDTGNQDKNEELSEMRAKSVAEYLVENGINKSRLSSKGFGQNQPVASNETEEGRQLNRRTTIKILGK